MTKYLKLIGFILLYVGTYFLVMLPVELLWYNVLNTDSRYGTWYTQNVLLGGCAADLALLLAFYFLVSEIKKQNLFKVCNFKKISIKNIVVISVIGVSAGLFTVCFFKIPVIINRFPEFNLVFNAMIDNKTIITFIPFLFIGSVFKEVMFRGLIFNESRRALPLVAAAAVQGIMYALVFFNFILSLSVYGFLGAILFTVLYLRTNSLWGSIVAQITSTGIMFAIRNVIVITNQSSIYLTIPAFLVMVVSIMYFLHINPRQKAKLAPAQQA